MKVVSLERTHKLEVMQKDAPKPDGNLAVIQIDKCGICGSETHFWYDIGDQMKGTIMGHEYAGIVVDPGSNTKFKKGDRVVPIATCGCGKCYLCHEGNSNVCQSEPLYMGGYGEYTICNADSMFKIPDGLSFLEACMTEPCATGLHAVNYANVKVGDTVCVIGAGIIGLSCAVFSKLAGAKRVALIDINMKKAQKALEWGDVDAIFDGSDEKLNEKLMEYNGGIGFDKIFECSGAPACQANTTKITRRKGKIVFVGAAPVDTPMPLSDALFGEMDLLSVYAYSWDDFEKTLEAIADGRLNVKNYGSKVITLDEVPQAFDDIVNRRVDDIKVIIDVSKK